MMKTVLALLFAFTASADVTLTFPAALERASQARAAQIHDSVLDALPVRTLPVVRAETAYSSAENLNLLSEPVDRSDAFTAIVSVDYPLLDAGRDRRRVEALRADVELRRLALDDSETVFRETLDAFTQLYLAEQRIQLLRDGAARAAALRQRAQTMLDAGEISNITAAAWHDQALATESALVDLELQRLEAETRLKQLMGDTSSEPLHAQLTLDAPPAVAVARVAQDAEVQRASIALQEATAQRRPQLMLSAFGGVAAVPNSVTADDGTFGIYGVRLSLTLPMFEAAATRRLAEAQMQFEEATRASTAAETARENRIGLLRFAISATDKRLALLRDAVEVAKQRQQSVERLVRAGARAESDLVAAANEIARRESDLLALRVERWKLEQRLQRIGAALL